MNIGKEISGIRKERRMTQEEFGRLFHVTRQTVSNWENEKSYPDLQILVDISDMFEISLDKLMKEDKHMVKTMDKQRHYGRIGKIAISIIAIVLIIVTGYAATWNIKKSGFEKKQETILQKYGFEQEALFDEDGVFVESLDLYSVQKDGMKYMVYPAEFPDILDFKLDVPSSGKFIIVTCNEDEKMINIRMDNKFTTIRLIGEMTEDQKETFSQDSSAEYSLDDNGKLPDKGVDDEMKIIYNKRQKEIQTAVKEMKKMYQELY